MSIETLAAARAPSLTRNATWMAAGSAGYALSQWVIAIILARLGGPEAVGLFAFGTALSMPIIVLSQFALRQVLVTDVRNRYAFADFYRLRVAATLAGFLLIALASLALGYRGEALIAIVGIGAGRCCESISDIHYGRLQRDERLDRVAQFTMLRGLHCLVAVASVYAYTHSIAWAGIAFGLGCAASLAVVDSRSRSEPETSITRRRGRWSRLYMLSLANVSTPLAISQVFNNINGNVPRYVLTWIGGTALVGQYAVIEHFTTAANLVVQALGQAAAPRLAKLYASQALEPFWSLVLRFCAGAVGIGICGTVVAAFIGPWLIHTIYGPNFPLAETSFVWVMFAATLMFAASVFGYAITATGAFRGLAWRYAVIMLTTLMLALWFAPQWGIPGVAAAMAGGYLVGCIVPLMRLLSISRTPAK